MRITAVLGKAARLVGLLVFMGGSSAKAAVEEQKDHIEEGNTHPMIMLKNRTSLSVSCSVPSADVPSFWQRWCLTVSDKCISVCVCSISPY